MTTRVHELTAPWWQWLWHALVCRSTGTRWRGFAHAEFIHCARCGALLHAYYVEDATDGA